MNATPLRKTVKTIPSKHETTQRPFHGAHIAVRNLGHSYRKSDGKVLDDLNFEIEPGEIVALLGRSGCGKSTLLHMLAGLSLPSEGEVLVNGNQVFKPSPKWVMMFQEPSIFPWLTVAQNASLGLKFNQRKHEIPTRIPEVLKLVDLENYADRNAQELSGGQQQRVALARSLAREPEMLLLDEPLSALDAFTRRSLQKDIRAIAKNIGLTLVIVTHDVGEAVRMADRVMVLKPGSGQIANDTKIGLSEQERDDGVKQFASEHDRLMEIYSEVAGVQAIDDENELLAI